MACNTKSFARHIIQLTVHVSRINHGQKASRWRLDVSLENIEVGIWLISLCHRGVYAAMQAVHER